MKKEIKYLIGGIIFTVLFAVFTILVATVDRASAGESGAIVGFSKMNDAVFCSIGKSELFEKISKLCGYLVIVFAFCFVILAIIQLIKRKSLKKIDKNLYVLGGFFVVVAILYVLFNIFSINDRPVIVDGILEPSYPSSHTLLALTFCGAIIIELPCYIKNTKLKNLAICIVAIVGACTLIGRILSGMHWITDIFGAILLSVMLIFYYLSLRTKLCASEE